MPTRAKANRSSVVARELSLTLQRASESAAMPERAQLRRWVKAALRRSAAITVRIVDEAEGRALNHQFRGKDYATNVLTFVYDDVRNAKPGGDLCGDIVLCAPVIECEAQAQGKQLVAHYAHLTVHGVLHLQGYDHQSGREAKAMEQLEIDVLAGLGFDNPYLGAATVAPRKLNRPVLRP